MSRKKKSKGTAWMGLLFTVGMVSMVSGVTQSASGWDLEKALLLDQELSGGERENRKEGEESEPKAVGSYWRDHFSLHGYLTTGYIGTLDNDAPRLSAEQLISGVPFEEGEGTADYRLAALNLRYAPSTDHIFVLQASHRRLGESPLQDLEDDIELDWLFYQWKATDHTSLKLGRFPVPAGIFNEVRDVGVILPFFRPSYNFYREGGFFTETVDGIGINHEFFPDGRWNLIGDVYYGEYDILEQSASDAADTKIVEVSEALGFQLWLETPISGVRFGVGGSKWDVGEESFFNFGREEEWRSLHSSFEADFSKWVARFEYRILEFPLHSPPRVVDNDGEVDLYYLQLGYRATQRWSFWVQSEYADVWQNGESFASPLRFNNLQSNAASVVFSWRPSVVFRGEYHAQRFDFPIGVVPVFSPAGNFLGIDFQLEEYKTNFFIVSASVSF